MPILCLDSSIYVDGAEWLVLPHWNYRSVCVAVPDIWHVNYWQQRMTAGSILYLKTIASASGAYLWCRSRWWLTWAAWKCPTSEGESCGMLRNGTRCYKAVFPTHAPNSDMCSISQTEAYWMLSLKWIGFKSGHVFIN